MEDSVNSPSRKPNLAEESSANMSHAYKIMDESKIKPIVSNETVRPLSSKNIANRKSFESHKEEDKVFRKSSTIEDVLQNALKSLDLINSPCDNNSQNLTTAKCEENACYIDKLPAEKDERIETTNFRQDTEYKYEDYAYDERKLSIEKDICTEKIPSNPGIEYKSMGTKVEVTKVDDVNATSSNTLIFETNPVEKKETFRYCYLDCKGAHKKITPEKKQKKRKEFNLTDEENSILCYSWDSDGADTLSEMGEISLCDLSLEMYDEEEFDRSSPTSSSNKK